MFIPYSESERAELVEAVRTADQHLTDCRERHATKYLTDLMEEWAGTREIDFDYVASIVQYEREEFAQNLAKGGLRLLEFFLPGNGEADPADWWKQT